MPMYPARPLILFAVVLAAASLGMGSACAQSSRATLDAASRAPTANEIAEALRPKDLRKMGPAAPKENSSMVVLTFETGSSGLTASDKAALREYGVAFKELIPAVPVIIEGHADPRGGDDYNLDLSRRRAYAVRDYLVGEFGGNAKQFQVVGYGKTRLKDPDHPTAAVNRRVEFVTRND